MTESVDQQNPAQRMTEIYPQYMEMIRTFVSEGIIEVDDPTEKQKQWAHRAAMGNNGLENIFARLARLTSIAYKQRYLEGMPMLINVDNPADPPDDFEPTERFHLLRLLVKDYREFNDVARSEKFPDLHPVLYWVQE